jgi:hypothetical protein
MEWLGFLALTSPIWLLAAVRMRRVWLRRRAAQAFAAERRLRFLGTIASDARRPYTAFDRVAGSVLLSNVLEGESNGLPIRMFDLNTRVSGRWTAVLVTVEGRLHLGARAERVIAARPDALIETNLDILFVSPRRLLDASELPTWLAFATELATAMEEDAKIQLFDET